MAAPQHTHQPIEADTNDDADSAIGVRSLASSTTSIGSSILKSREENGRTYHAYKDGKYVLPDDENEKDRLDLTHHVHLIAYGGKLTLLPEGGKEIQRVLDVGTGTGIWAIDYADEHPEAEVLGVDLSPQQPNFLPPNLKFEIDDLEEPWLYKQKFDLIHIRDMTGSFKDWSKVFQKAFEFTTPGGYLHLSEFVYPFKCDDGTVALDSPIAKWGRLTLEATEKMGAPVNSALRAQEQMEKAGWTDITVTRNVYPNGRWPKDARLKEIGLWSRANLLMGLEAFSLALYTRVLGWAPEEVQQFLAAVRKDALDPKLHLYMPRWTFIGRKPE